MTKPTIGIEIELPWRTMLRRVDEEAAELLTERHSYYAMNEVEKARMRLAFDTLDEQYKDTIEAVFGDKITKGNDGYTEFALSPQYEHTELTEVVDGLYEQGVLCEGETYPLHITLGSISRAVGAWVVLTAVELAGGATPERMEERHSWSRKGRAGLLERRPDELELDKIGIEMRSLVINSQRQSRQALEVAQCAGGILLTRLHGNIDADDTWNNLRTYLTESLEEKITNVRRQWPNPQIDPIPWQSLAGAMRDTDWSTRVESGILDLLSDS